MEDLNMKHVSAKFVPWLLTEDQKNNCLNVCYDLREHVRNDPQILSKVVTRDETWCYGYDPETKQALSQWKAPNSPKVKKGQQVQLKVNIMLISFFYANGIVHKEFVPPGQTVNQQFYLKVLKRLCDSVRKKRPEMWSSGDLFLHHDNAPAHTALSVQQFLAINNMTVIPHTPYSPDLAPCDFFLFPRMKGQMKGKCFADVSEVKKKTLEVLKNISTEEFQKCFQQWEKRWYKCIESKGGYFEGDKSYNSIKPNKPF